MPLLDRFRAAAEAGFRGLESTFPYEAPASAIAERLHLHWACAGAFLNVPPGDIASGECGSGALPGRERDFMAGDDRALTYALATGCRRVHALSDLWPAGRDKSESRTVLVANLSRAADLAAPHGIHLLIEPISPRDIPGYFLNTPAEAESILDRVERANVLLQLDLYQVVAGDLAKHIRRLLPRIGRIQIAGVLERHSIRLAMTGWVGCEYRPADGTLKGFGWARPWGIGALASAPA